MVWDGRTERRADPNDHDKLTRLLVSVENHVNNFDKHVEDDKTNFQSVNSKIDAHAKYIYIGIGIIGVLQFLLKGH